MQFSNIGLSSVFGNQTCKHVYMVTESSQVALTLQGFLGTHILGIAKTSSSNISKLKLVPIKY